MVTAHRSEDACRETVSLIEAEGGRAAYHLANVGDSKQVTGLIAETVRVFGGLDLLVNNHTLRASTPLEDISDEEWRAVLGVTLDGSFFTARAAVPYMRRAGGGSIVNIGGLYGHIGTFGSAHVSAAKSGIEGLTRAQAVELAGAGITVNCVVPGGIATDRRARAFEHRQEGRESGGGRARALPPVGRIGLPEEIAAMVRMLCGPEARYVTGQCIHVNGGEFRF
jgi:3-oxoacyl-[acyl-carrier protein] reductase